MSAPAEGEVSTLLLCVNKKIFMDLLGYYPAEKRYFEQLSLQRRREIMRIKKIVQR